MEKSPSHPPTVNDWSNGNGNGNGKHPTRFVPIYAPEKIEEQTEGLDLLQSLAVLQRRWPLIAGITAVAIAAVSLHTVTQTPLYEGKFQILVEPVTAENNLAELNPANTLRNTGLDYQTQIQVLQSPELLAGIIRQVQKRYADITYNSVVSNLTIIRPQETKILEIRYRNSSPEKIHFILEHLAQGYLKYSLEERQTNLRQGIQFVNDQLPLLQQRVDQLQGHLQTFRQDYNLIDPETQAPTLAKRTAALAQQRLEIDQKLAETRTYFTTLQGETGAVAALNDAKLYQDLVSQLRQIETQIAAESTRFQTQNPEIQVLLEKRERLLPLLRQEAKRVLGVELAKVATDIQTLNVRSQAISQAEAQLKQQVQQLPFLARQYTDLQRQLQVATESLDRFLANRETLQIEAAQTEIPWQLLAAPVKPQAPISPNVQRNLLLGILSGLFLGIGTALLLETLDNVFRSPEILREKTKLPLLGTIPFCEQIQSGDRQMPLENMTTAISRSLHTFMPDRQYLSGYDRSSTFLEAFRLLYTNIRLLSADTPIHSLTISSALPSEGKSTIAANLARAAAAMQQRVLLVDADLRRPQAHEILDLPNLRGLSNLLATDLRLQDVIQTVPSIENLSVITAGQIPPDPTKLLSSKKMQQLMASVCDDFDLVIYDTPPLIGLADASLLATYTEGIVAVVGLGKTKQSILKQALNSLAVAHTPVLGIVANGLQRSADRSYGYYHYQNYKQNLEPENGKAHFGE